MHSRPARCPARCAHRRIASAARCEKPPCSHRCSQSRWRGVVGVTLARRSMSIPRRDAFYAGLTASTSRARQTASALLVIPSAVVVWIALAGRAGQFFITAFGASRREARGSGAGGGAEHVLTAVVLAGAIAARRAVEFALPPSPAPQRTIPFAALTGLLSPALLVIGMRSGSVDGRGGLLGAFGVLAQARELDLSPPSDSVASCSLAGCSLGWSRARGRALPGHSRDLAGPRDRVARAHCLSLRRRRERHRDRRAARTRTRGATHFSGVRTTITTVTHGSTAAATLRR